MMTAAASPLVIHHNPDCATARHVIAIVEQAGYAPQIVREVETDWPRPQVLVLFAAAGRTQREALRATKSPAAELEVLGEDVADETILAGMLEHPLLVTRPIAATPRGVRFCRPSMTVLDLIDRLAQGLLAKKDAGLVLDAQGRRVSSSVPRLAFLPRYRHPIKDC